MRRLLQGILQAKSWWIHATWLALCTTLYVTYEVGARHGLPLFLQTSLFPLLQRPVAITSDVRYLIRGPQKPKNPIVIVELDERSIELLGRWPWRRDYTAYLIDKIFEAGADVVGLDLFFSEPQRAVPEELEQKLRQTHRGDWLAELDFDGKFESVIQRHREKLVLAWASESECRPAFSTFDYCPVTLPEALATHPEGFQKFSLTSAPLLTGKLAQGTPLSSVSTLIPNIERFQSAANFSGFVNDYRDKDGIVRRTGLMTFAGGWPYPTLPLAMSAVRLGEHWVPKVDSTGRLDKLVGTKTHRELPLNSLGIADIQFRGGERSFPYVSAADLIETTGERHLASNPREILKGAMVFVGLTALGLTNDVVATPFDPTMPGVEVHANVLDNILANDFLRVGDETLVFALFLLLLFGGIAAIWIGNQLEAVPVLAIFISMGLGVALLDSFVLFPMGWSVNLSFHYIYWFGALGCLLALKYVEEEKSRKFVRSAFSMYVAPAVVDSILKDPRRLSLGGRKENISVLFTDIRSFTSFSEKMDPRRLSDFLNDYLGKQTEIVFENGGTLDKYIGDAMMCFWGAPLPMANHSAKAISAVLQMIQGLEGESERYLRDYGIPVKVGFGLHSGEASVGNMGCATSFNYTALGDNVNLASRLESATKFLGVQALTTRETLDRALDSGIQAPPHRRLLLARLKGKATPVELVELRAKAYPADLLRQFDSARKDFTERRWGAAAQAFTELFPEFQKHNPTEAICASYASKCLELEKTPPLDSAKWEPSWDFLEK